MLRVLPLLLPALLAGCVAEGRDDGRTVAVATTSVVADLVRTVAGEEARVVALVPPGADPHDFEPRPDDIAALAEADVVFMAGGEVDEWLDETLRSAGSDAVPTVLAPAESEDPHWWLDPHHARGATGTIASVLGEEERIEGAVRRGEAQQRRLLALDRHVEECVDRLRPDERKLVTTHDSLGHFARRYGFEVIGAVIPSRSTQAQASAGETARLVETLRRERVKAIFTEHGVSSRVERAIAEEAGARLGRPLWTDALDEGMTYVEAMRANVDAIVTGLSGGRERCSTG